MAIARTFLLVLPALVLGLAAARADETTIISQQGDALARATSAQALVQPMPAYPPNTPPMPKPKPVPAPANNLQEPAPAVPASAPALTVVPAAGPRGDAPSMPAAPPPGAPPAARPPVAPHEGVNRTVLIALGAMIALGLFLLERRKS